MSVSPTLSRRLAVIGVSLASVAVCLALAWWQWQRYSSASGTWQNLGYVLQWPLFGLFPAFVFWRLRRLRLQAELAEDDPGADTPAGRPAEPDRTPTPDRRVSMPDDDEDPELAAYNRYLAELARNSEEGRPSR